VMQTKIPTGARLLLGLIYFVFGLNGLFNFLPAPPMPETAMGFLGGLVSSGYFLPVLAATQTMAGFLLFNRLRCASRIGNPGTHHIADFFVPRVLNAWITELRRFPGKILLC
jgi:hypothetical protein